ncbi:MAG TPA: NAD(P)H-dependent oxidoreductase [Cyclobacteriaceae bacterium]
MKILIVLAHPEWKSFNTAMYTTAIEALQKQGHEVKTSDLYRMNLNPISDRSNFSSVRDPAFLKLQLEEVYATEVNGFIPDIAAEQEKVEWCDLMIWQFPLWWFSLPAILKGWVDRVFAMGRFYGDGRFYSNGVFKNKKAVLSLTTGGPLDNYVDNGFNGDINGMLRPIHRGILQFVGFTVLAPQLSFSVAHLSEKERKQLLTKWSERLKNIFSEASIQVGKY